MGYTLGYTRGTPPVKMDCFQNKGVAGKAFCKCLNRKRMDDGRFCYSWGGRCGNSRRNNQASWRLTITRDDSIQVPYLSR